MMSQALKLICQAEGIAADQVAAVRLVDDEIEVKVAHPSGRTRLLVYPLAALRGARPGSDKAGSDEDSAVPSDSGQPDALSETAQPSW